MSKKSRIYRFSQFFQNADYYVDYYDTPVMCESTPNRSVTDIACGYNHSLYLEKGNDLYTMGFNFFGQCGFPPSAGEIFDYYKKVEIPLEENE